MIKILKFIVILEESNNDIEYALDRWKWFQMCQLVIKEARIGFK